MILFIINMSGLAAAGWLGWLAREWRFHQFVDHLFDEEA